MSTDLIKRIETLEKQMAMIDMYGIPCQIPEFNGGSRGPILDDQERLIRVKPKYATGILVEGLDKPIEHKKQVKFTHQFHVGLGWSTEVLPMDVFLTIYYMGECKADGDMFYAKSCEGYIHILKGHLNSGTY